MEPEKNQSDSSRSLRGLYRHVHISVKTLDLVIVLGIAVLTLVVIWALKTGGYHVTFDSCGGSDIPYQEHRYGELVTEPAPPTRQGYTFDGWYWDEGYTLSWDFAQGIVENDFTLYAKWIPDS